MRRCRSIAPTPLRTDPAASIRTPPRHLPKINFLMLMRDERLATLRSQFEDATETLTIFRDGKQVGARAAEQPDRPSAHRTIHRRVHEDRVCAGRHGSCMRPATASRTSPPNACTSSTWRAVREFERMQGRAVDPLRFRANLYIDGVAPWAEFGWLDKQLRVGPTNLAVFARTRRCEATNVDPTTGAPRYGDPGMADAVGGAFRLRHLCQGRHGRRACGRRASASASLGRSGLRKCGEQPRICASERKNQLAPNHWRRHLRAGGDPREQGSFVAWCR